MKRFLASILLIAAVAGIGYFIVSQKNAMAQNAKMGPPPEPITSITAQSVATQKFQRTTTVVGTIKALQSVTLRNEIAGIVKNINLNSGELIKKNDVLVNLNVGVENADLKVWQAELVIAKAKLDSFKKAYDKDVGTALTLSIRQSEYDIAHAKVERAKAIISQKTLVAPFDARVGLVDVFTGQYLDAGTKIASLQSVDNAYHVDFRVSQNVARQLKIGNEINAIIGSNQNSNLTGKVVAIDSEIDRATRNAMIRAKFESVSDIRPGGSLLVKVPIDSTLSLPTVPVTALRRGPEGTHVFVIIKDKEGKQRAQLRIVTSGPMVGDQVFIYKGLKVGELVAAKGSFKLRDQALVAIKDTK